MTADVVAMPKQPLSLDAQREAFASRRFLAMPLAGSIAWTIVAIGGATLPLALAVWVLFLATGMIVWLGVGLSRLTGEDFMDKTRPKNAFDALFFSTVAMALLAWAIAIPFFRADPTSLPLSVGILSGMMWLPLSWTIRHWIGWFHAIVRTALVLVAHYAWPDHRFVAVPLAIVAIYLVTIVVLERRWRARQGAGLANPSMEMAEKA
ncbi:DUF7010 family protein [Luteimonas vadosa]|uniref:DUF308 domain-containing protein n=1 Tax=Luteimonas vadosa TaxID=1165507 RepID=A0ABP9DVY0_9GAMM